MQMYSFLFSVKSLANQKTIKAQINLEVYE